MLINTAQFQLFFLALTRILATIIHVPVLGGRMVPNQVKIGIGFFLALIILPLQPVATANRELALVEFAVAIGREILIGTIAGFTAELIFGAIQITGHLMGLGSGFAAAQILNPATGDNGTPLDQIFVMTSFLIFFVLNGHHIFILGLEKTFELIPLNSPLPEMAGQNVISLSAGLLTTGVQMALPIIGTLLMTDIALGLLARVAPQIQVFFLGLPLKIAVAFIALALTLSTLLPNIRMMFNGLGSSMLGLLGK